MILPTTYNNALVEKLKANVAKFPKYTMVDETSEDSSPNLQPPYCAVYADFDDSAKVSNLGYLQELPVSIYVACHSGAHQLAADSFNQAFLMAIEVIKLLSGEYTLLDSSGAEEYSQLKVQELPIIILRKSASGSIVQAQFQYSMYNIME